jgi:hypothetical protein
MVSLRHKNHPCASISKKVSHEPSAKIKDKADKVRSLGTSTNPTNTRASAYLRNRIAEGSKSKPDVDGSSDSRTAIFPSSNFVTNPETKTLTFKSDTKTARTFIDSVISLCSRSLASSGDIGEPVPGEDIFLFLVSIYGVQAAQAWSKALAIPHEKSYSLLSRLWYGK